MTHEEAVEQIEEFLDTILFQLDEDFEELEIAVEEALNIIYAETQEVVTN